RLPWRGSGHMFWQCGESLRTIRRARTDEAVGVHDRIVDVMDGIMKFTLLTRGASCFLTDPLQRTERGSRKARPAHATGQGDLNRFDCAAAKARPNSRRGAFGSWLGS